MTAPIKATVTSVDPLLVIAQGNSNAVPATLVGSGTVTVDEQVLMFRIGNSFCVLAGGSGGGSGGGIALPTPDVANGLYGTFGVGLGNALTVPGGTANFDVAHDVAWTLDPSGSARVVEGTIDNDYMHWDWTGTKVLTVKKAGWYWMLYSAGCDTGVGAPDGPVYMLVQGADLVGSLDFVGPTLLSPRDTGQTATSLPVLVYLPANTVVSMTLDASATTGDFDLGWAALLLVPLFNLDGSGSGDNGIPIATPALASIDSTTYPNENFSGDDNLTVLKYSDEGVAFAFAQDGDDFPRVLVCTNPVDGIYMGDGTVDAFDAGNIYYDGGWKIRDFADNGSVFMEADGVSLAVGDQDLPNVGPVAVAGPGLQIGTVAVITGEGSPQGSTGGNAWAGVDPATLYVQVDAVPAEALWWCTGTGDASTATWELMVSPGGGTPVDVAEIWVNLVPPDTGGGFIFGYLYESIQPDSSGRHVAVTITTPPMVVPPGEGFSLDIYMPAAYAGSGTVTVAYVELDVTNLTCDEQMAVATAAESTLSTGDTTPVYDAGVQVSTGSDLSLGGTSQNVISAAGGLFFASCIVEMYITP